MKIMKLITVFLMASIILNSYAAEKPKWIADTSKGCPEGSLCAVGEGSDREEATKNANVALVKIFENKISVSFTSKLSADNGKIVEEVSEQVKEATQAALEGVEVKKTYEQEGKVYILVAINKRKAAEGLKTEIEAIDTKLQVGIKDVENENMPKLEQLYFKREALNKRHQFLVNKSLSCPVKYEEIYKGKIDSIKKVIVHIYLNEDGPKEIEQALADSISGLGYKVTRGKTRSSEATHIISGEVSVDKQHLSVEGFEKYKFLVKINAMTSKKVASGSFKLAEIVTARNLAQAHEKAIDKLIEDLQEKVKELKIK